MASRFQVTGHFETGALNDPRWHWTLKGKRYSVCVLKLLTTPRYFHTCIHDTTICTLESQILLRFALWPDRLELHAMWFLRLPSSLSCANLQQGHFPYIMLTHNVDTNAQNDLKMTLDTNRSKVPHIMLYKCPRVPNFTPFRYTTSHFQDIRQFFIFPWATMINFILFSLFF